jgi:adenylyltransferase/sulfurtransferase
VIPKDLTAPDAQSLAENLDDLKVLDVRKPTEWEVARLPGATLATDDTLREIREEWDPETPILVYCHHGIRSLIFGLRLRMAGFTNVYNLKGGIEKWSLLVDPSVPRYRMDSGSAVVVSGD